MKFQKGSIFKPDKDYYKIAGMLLVIGGIMYVLAINIGESLFPGYSVATNSLSDIGGMLPLIQPAANIFNSVNIILGILIISSAYLIIKSGGCRLFSCLSSYFRLLYWCIRRVSRIYSFNSRSLCNHSIFLWKFCTHIQL